MTKRLGLSLGFWVEAALALAAIATAIATMLWPEWIEMVFKVDPDEGSGALELAIVVVLVGISVANSLLAGRQWRQGRQRSAAPTVR